MKQVRRGICIVRRKSDGLIRCTMADGTDKYVTDEEWEVELRRRLDAEQGALKLRARLQAELEAKVQAELERRLGAGG